MSRHMKNKHPNIVVVESVNEEEPFVSLEIHFC